MTQHYGIMHTKRKSINNLNKPTFLKGPKTTIVKTIKLNFKNFQFKKNNKAVHIIKIENKKFYNYLCKISK